MIKIIPINYQPNLKIMISKAHQTGFTFIEFIITIIIIGLIAVVSSEFFTKSAEAILQSRAANQQSIPVNIAFNRMKNELQFSEAHSVQLSSPTNIEFRNAQFQQVHYWLEGSNLYRQENENQKQLLLSNVQNLTISWQTLSDSHYIELQLSQASNKLHTFLKTIVFPRNS